MLFCDLLRVSSLLVAGVATALGVVTIVVANQDADEVALAVAGAWWLIGAAAGLWLGRSGAGVGVDRAGCSQARAWRPTSRPRRPARIAFMRLWPIGAFALLVGVAGWFWPQVAAIGAGYAILIALAWRGRERAVTAIEARDGVRFYVEPSNAFEPVRLLRTPGLYRDRAPTAKPPPPPPVEAG